MSLTVERVAGGLAVPAGLDPISARGGLVVSRSADGPRFPRGRTRMAVARPDSFVPLLSPRDRRVVGLLTLGWLGSQALFWQWWLQPAHLVTWTGLVVNSLLIAYLAVLPVYFVVAVNRLRGVDPALPVPDVRVAFVVTKAPSEPWPVARRTLLAMRRQRFPRPYDVWLCDEDPAEETLEWCRDHGVHVATRRGVEEYHRPEWPRRTKCKEGNLAWFYDQWGYRDYDVVAQLDCDHVPGPTYLTEMVRPFADLSIGYVAAPSVCDANVDNSWAARGRLYREATFHGPYQTGHQRGLAPSSIGSHYAVRTAAVRLIGGLGPELAEDFSTSFLLASAGWQGAFAHRAEAHGDGPLTLRAMLTQEFQWSRSLVTLLLGLVPSHLGRLPWQLRLRFLFSLCFYPLLALTTAAGLILPPIAAVTGAPWVEVDYFEFLAHWWLVSLWLVLIALLLQRQEQLRPSWAPVVSWENWLYVLARWPYIAHGVLAAVRQRFRPRPIRFLVTPKTRGGLEPLPTGVVLPYLVITLALAAAALVGERTQDAVGYVFLCLLGSATYAVVSLALPFLHAREAGRSIGTPLITAWRRTAAIPTVLAVAVLPPLITASALYPAYLVRVLGW